MSLSWEPRFGFGNMFRFRVFCLNVRESISYAGMRPSERNRKDCKASRKGCKRVLHTKGTYAGVVSTSVCFPFCQLGSHDGGRRDSYCVANWLMEGYGDIVDIYSCLHRLVS